MMTTCQLWVFFVITIAIGHCRPKLDRVEEGNEELSGPDVTFDYHNPPNSDVIAREEETEEGAHRLSKRLADRVEERNEELSGRDVTFDYHNPPNSDVIARQEETEESARSISKRLVDRVEERNEELSGPDVTFDYHNPPNSDTVSREEEETEEGAHRILKRLVDRVEERNEELSGPDVTFDYHNPPNSDTVSREEEETEEGAHRLSKRLAEPPQQKVVYLNPIYLVDDKTYSDLIKTSQSKSLEEGDEEQYDDNNEDDLDLAAAIVYRPLFAYRLQKSRRLARRRNPRSIHSTLPGGSKSKLLYRTDNDLISKVIIIFLPVYTYAHKSQLQFDDSDDARATRSATTSATARQEDHPKKQEEKEEGQYYQQNGEILIAQPTDAIALDDGDPLEPAESSVVHPLFLYKYRVAYYKKKALKEEKKKKRRQQ